MPELIRLHQVDCRDCYKCIRTCQLKAIRYSEGHAEIIQEECVQCGECLVACPRHGQKRGDIMAVRRLVRLGREVVFSVSPSFIGEFKVGSIDDFRETMKMLGVRDVQEMAIGAELVSREYEKLMESGEMDLVISSACPSINLLIRKYYPDLLRYLAPVESPMEVHCRILREMYPDAVIVFVGSCYARQSEALETKCCDAVIAFSDIKEWMSDVGIEAVNNGMPEIRTGMRSRRYDRFDGIIKSMTRVSGWSRVAIDGLDDCRAALEEIRQGRMNKVFVEMEACQGSCVNGPATRSDRYSNRVSGTVAINNYGGDNDFGIEPTRSIRKTFHRDVLIRRFPTEEAVNRALKRLDKDSADTALNCGCCGYSTCREMAEALCLGKAEYDMCLPYLREKAERRSHAVVESTLEAADKVIERQMRVVQNIASILGETTAETKVMLSKLKEAVQDEE